MFLSNSFSQNKESYLFKKVIFGSSVTYIWDSYDNSFFQEYTWNVNGAISLNKRLFLGVQALTIYAKDSKSEWENYYIYGVLGQFNLLQSKEYRAFIETSVNKGNYCTCGVEFPYLKDNLYYFGLGAGFDIPLKFISENLYIDMSFYNYTILNKIKTKYNYTQYIIGLNYYLGKK